MAIHNKLNGEKHLISRLKKYIYDPTKSLIPAWDFNVARQMSSITNQIDYDKKKVYILEEILRKPENNTPALTCKIKNKLYRDKHIGG